MPATLCSFNVIRKTFLVFVYCNNNITNNKSSDHGSVELVEHLSVCVCVRVCKFQPSESGSASAIRAWMISQASLQYSLLKWESHSFCVPPLLIMFSNDSAKRRGIPTACHQPAQKCADGVITGAVNAHHPQFSCPTWAFLFAWERRRRHQMTTLCRTSNGKQKHFYMCRCLISQSAKVL